ncbi:MAG: hypothetical protein ACLQU2_18945 [Candidatus Binataceae bacterium]
MEDRPASLRGFFHYGVKCGQAIRRNKNASVHEKFLAVGLIVVGLVAKHQVHRSGLPACPTFSVEWDKISEKQKISIA